MPKMIVIVEVLVAQRKAKLPLADQRADFMFDQVRGPVILEAADKPIDQSDRTIRRAQQQSTAVRRDQAAVERRLHAATFNRCKSRQIRDTLCRHRRASSEFEKMLLHNTFRRVRTPMHPTPLRYPG
jgi:hypothetical protein